MNARSFRLMIFISVLVLVSLACGAGRDETCPDDPDRLQRLGGWCPDLIFVEEHIGDKVTGAII